MRNLIYPWLFGDHHPGEDAEEDDMNIKPSTSTSSSNDSNSTSNSNELAHTDALVHYERPGVHPPGARVDARVLTLAASKPIPLWQMWKYGLAAATKTTQITADVLSHHIWGPLRPSWGIELTVISALMRNAAAHSALVSITTIRTLMGLSGLVPLPSDAIVTPVTFTVKKRGLRGFLKELDDAETGKRELSGEWVVGKKTWQRLQNEWKAGKKQEQGQKKARTERVVLYIHGGAYYVSSAASQRLISIPLAKYTDARVFALDYRLAPESQFPGPVHDVVSGYFRLVEDLNIPPENIVVCGDSAGGGLCLALLLYLRDNGYPMPSGAVLLCPWVDLTMSCKSWDTNSKYDVVPMPSSPDDPLHPVQLYLGANIDKYITHSYASPLFGDFTGLPPLMIQSGDAEVLRDEITLLAHKASLAGVTVRHELYEDAIHVFHFYPFLEAAMRAFLSIRDFVRHDLAAKDKRSTLNERAFRVELEDSEKTMVVSGDGVLVAAGMDNVEEELGLDTDTAGETTESEEELRRASWAQGEYQEGAGEAQQQQQQHNTSTISRIRAALSVIIPDTTTASAATAASTSTASTSSRHHKRTRSSRSLSVREIAWQGQGANASGATTPTASRRAGAPRHIDLPPRAESPNTLVMRSSHAPSPSIRRRASSMHTSYSDLASLVSDMERSGPANETLLYGASPS